MQSKKSSLPTISFTALLSLGLAAGCHHDSNTVNAHGQDFAQPGVTSSVERISNAQAVKGAAADAMLYDHHFDGILLNSLGCKKLDQMMTGTSANKPLVVYLNMPQNTAKDRQAAVAEYVKNAGVDDSAVQIVIGPNPHVTTPTAYNLAEVYKDDGGTMTGAAADATAATAAAPASSGK
jgi:hypothetical protein